MAPRMLSPLLRQLNRLLESRQADGLSDAELLERFAERGDEAAFEVLVWRHGPMVHGLCRRLLRRTEDADDAFQAAFLILVRKARSVSNRASLASWLYKVTYRVALEARAREAKHAAAPADGDIADRETADDVCRRDLERAVAEEVDRLPEKYRLPVVLCYLSGQTTEEAARRLGCPRGTVLSRLAAARQRLRCRLVRRGVAPAAAAEEALERKATAAPAVLVGATVRAAAWMAAGRAGGAGIVSGSVLSLTEGALKAMFVKKLKWAAAVLAAAALVGGGVGLWFRQPAAAEPPARTRAPEPPAKPVEEPAEEAVEVRPPVGVWEKEVGAIHMTLRIKDNHRVYGSCSGVIDDGKKFDFSINADYSVTPDHVLYGVITDVGLPTDEGAQGSAKELDDQLKTSLEMMQLLDDQPFSLRYRLDDNVLTIKDVRFGDPKEKGDNEIALLLGRWKKKADSGRDAAGRDGR